MGLKMKNLLLLALALLLGHLAGPRAFAIPLPYAGALDVQKQQAQFDDFAAADPQGYEEYRAQKVRSATSPEEFFEWATPAEVEDDFDVTEAEKMFEEASAGPAAVNVTIHLRDQTLDATGGGLNIKRCRVATGRAGYETPIGCHMAFKGEKVHLSRKYHNYPMANSVFFVGGDAFHVGNVNHRSHGCVHLDRGTSEAIFKAYMSHKKSFRVCVVR